MTAALIVAHGSPSAPERAERAIRALSDAAMRLMPGHTVRGATLAAKGALETAIDDLGDLQPLVYPMFMADGWFTRSALPERLDAAGAGSARITPPFGRDPAVWMLCRDAATAAATERGWDASETSLLLAAHGSPSDPRPKDAAEQAAGFIAEAGIFRSVTTGFVDEAPYLADAARIPAPAICLPFFAARAGHVEHDVPEALKSAAFDGVLLDPVGTNPQVPQIIAAALLACGVHQDA